MLDYFYTGSHTEEIISYNIAIVTISTAEGKEKIQLKKVVYILSFYINLVYL